MPNGQAPVQASQVVTQRVSVEPSARRDAAEPIGRDFADLVAEATANENPQNSNADNRSETSEADEQFSFSAVLPEDDDPSTFLVANAALSDTANPVVGLLNLAPTAQGDEATTTATPPEHAAPTDLLVDTSALFLPPDPNKPIQTTATVHSGEFGSLTWPPPENAASLQAALSSADPQTKALGATLTAPANLATPANEGGPSANRLAATLAPTATGDASDASANPAASGKPAAASGATGPAAASSSTQTSATSQSAPTTPLPDTSVPLTPGAQTQPTALTSAATPGASPTQATASNAAAAAPPPAMASAPPAAVQVYSRFIERFDGRAQEYQIRLDPPELGRVNVRIEIGADHRVHAVLATSDSNALSDLLRGQRALEQSLADAGIDLAEDGLRFELSDNGAQQSASGQRDAPTGETGGDSTRLAPEQSAQAGQPADQPSRWSRSRINIVA